MTVLKLGTNRFVEATASMIRLTGFYNSPAEYIPIRAEPDKGLAIKIENGSFSWSLPDTVKSGAANNTL